MGFDIGATIVQLKRQSELEDRHDNSNNNSPEYCSSTITQFKPIIGESFLPHQLYN